ncbi:aldo/keto reductase [Spirochaetia bacterium]|nr:aldo/keto reductase [Spirochaetia bacterium]
MEFVTLGITGLRVSKTAIGTVPLQRLTEQEAARLMRSAYDGGITYFDSADAYTGSEYKLGLAVHDVRDKVVISTKASTADYAEALKRIEKSLRDLNTDYIDIIQLHNPKTLPDPNDRSGAYAALVEAKQKGQVRHIGFTTHDLERASAAARSGLFETVQYPLSYLSGEKDEELIALCREKNIGLIAMKPFAGGMIRNPALSFLYFRAHENVVPIYGIQRQSELEALLELERNPPALDAQMRLLLRKGRDEFEKLFCRGCDRCQAACPQGIRPGYAGRMGDFLYRNPPHKYLTASWHVEMLKVPSCTGCGACVKTCPFGVDLRGKMKESHEIFMDLWTRYKRAGI